MDPFRRALLRGLAVVLPPLLTVVILLWAWNTIALYMLVPAENLARRGLTEYYRHWILPADAAPATAVVNGVTLIDGTPYRQTPDGRFMPAAHVEYVETLVPAAQLPSTADGFYSLYIETKWLPRHIVIPVFLCAFLLGLYLLGKFLAAGVGRFFWVQFERFITRLPLVRNVYSSVKQVTDFVFSESDLQYTRVVAIEYPRKGIWQLAFVTGESIGDIAAAANEPVLAVLVPTSPMPFTGFTVTVKRSETLDLSITMEQALQFIVSCGVVAPPHELTAALAAREHRVMPALPDATRQG
jgi:uncharacterized membrane protein